MDHNSPPYDSCCSAVEYIITTSYGCICDIKLEEIDNLPFDATNTANLLTLCGVSLPCQVHVSTTAPSLVDAPKLYALESLVSSLAPKSASSSQPPPQQSSKSLSSYAPNSPLLLTAPAPMQEANDNDVPAPPSPNQAPIHVPDDGSIHFFLLLIFLASVFVIFSLIKVNADAYAQRTNTT
ncbi:Lipid transfer protein [Medicago truncatula]|uniref:Lipid transfer protein n=2 Tax=Medicago truncatula TaxID=3880 RepID=G7JRZ3_MEDTR|nr:Lipid transfer protein [Medicago truncatula]